MIHSLAEDLDHILDHTSELWDSLREARLFITGGTGFFGKWLLESFRWANARRQLNAQAVVLSRDPEAFRAAVPDIAADHSIQFCPGDVRTFAFPDGRFSHVIHAATPSSAGPKEIEPEVMLDLIIQGTRHTLDFARQCGARVLFTSSGAVYGRQPPECTHLDEDYAGTPNPMDVRSAYGEGKRMAEQLCAIAHQRHGLEATIARCFAFVGPYLPLSAHFAIGNFIRDGLQGGPVRVAGDGTAYRSYLYAADLMIWLWTILLRGQPVRPYNVGSEEAVTIAELARNVADYFGTDVHISEKPNPGKPAERYVPSVQRAGRELGLKQWIALETAIDRTVRWHRSVRRDP